MIDVSEMVDETPEEFLTGELEIGRAMEFLMDSGIVTDYCGDYGEPGYTLDNPEGFFAIGHWWCNSKDCDYPDRYEGGPCDGQRKVHGVELHYRKLFERLEEAGMEIAFDDEWVVISEEDKAYRTQPDSYSWQRSALYTEEFDWLTPESDPADWIEWALNDSSRCLMSWFEDSHLEAVGFREYQCDYASGWYDGQTDDPKKITEGLKQRFGEDVDILYKLSGVGQFDIHWCVYIRTDKEEPNDDWESED